MKGSMHLTLGTVAGVSTGLIAIPDPELSGIFAISCMISSIFPDIDIPGSKISKNFNMASRIIQSIFGHRGFFHSPLCCILLSCGLYKLMTISMPGNIAVYAVAGFACGYFLHLIQDAVTMKGVRWFYPLRSRFHLTNFLQKAHGAGYGRLGLQSYG